MRPSNYGLDLLGTIIDTKLKKVDYAIFHEAGTLQVMKQELWHSAINM